MDRARNPRPDSPSAEVIDFDDALLASYSEAFRGELLAEAAMLARAFAPEGRREELEAMAHALSHGRRDTQLDRRRARGLAAALRRLARHPWDLGPF